MDIALALVRVSCPLVVWVASSGVSRVLDCLDRMSVCDSFCVP